ncbi:hypothetical protein [Dolichospermum circinale]|uniref:hypothetical protein n=2 Tax=Dolichospermum circinale TaxID=109265 RepID=UPI00232E2C26|nr:hypothetical protein [Dolichospermum circinale]MDB9456698.1 hypothetical protein [Dolichospermum circinale CS-541/06]MDB9462234.1 hypothetical protein [Dolichospermum circinale CS-541/04]MDB9548015.1 hypothetical protein [Dolichospermum circinale CS-1031]
MSKYRSVSNCGSAIGEAIGASMEKALAEKLMEVANLYGYHYVTSGVVETKSGKRAKKLLMSDNNGNQYNIDGVLANENMQPLILFESKYIRYQKHNRDKASWICHAHSGIRRRYHSIRSSIAVLAGSWSNSSQAMLTSNDINLFFIPFEFICELLSELDIDFNWGEKESTKAKDAWYKYNNLTTAQKDYIGIQMVSLIEENLCSLIENILDDTIDREITKIVVEIVSNLGEIKFFEFDNVESALLFLSQDDLKGAFFTADSLSLFDASPTFDT